MILFFILLIFQPASSQPTPQSMQDSEITQFLKTYTETHYATTNLDSFLYVSISSQCMYWVKDWEIKETYMISSGATGAGNLSGSNQTPLGLHIVAEKYGEDVPIGGILKSRIFTKKIADIYTDKTDVEEDHVTTRILWLKGIESGINLGKDAKGRVVDSYKRYIYIHGTPEEGMIGTPASHGCIRMVNRAVVELYDYIPVGTHVLILDK